MSQCCNGKRGRRTGRCVTDLNLTIFQCLMSVFMIFFVIVVAVPMTISVPSTMDSHSRVCPSCERSYSLPRFVNGLIVVVVDVDVIHGMTSRTTEALGGGKNMLLPSGAITDCRLRITSCVDDDISLEIFSLQIDIHVSACMHHGLEDHGPRRAVLWVANLGFDLTTSRPGGDDDDTVN
jgi:hypothetical protein